MNATVWDEEFFRRRAAGEQAAGHAQEPTSAAPPAPGHATIAGLLLARAGDDNTALLFEDQRWSWRELVLQAATRSALMQQLRPQEGPWHVGVLMENTPEYIFLIAGAALCGSTGAPKAVICSTGRWAFICQVNPIKFSPDDVAYNAMPIFHGNALMAALGPCLANGSAFAMRRRFSASGFLPDIRRFGATFFNYVGRSLAYVLAQPECPEESDNRLRFGFGTEASAQDRAEFSRRYGCPLLESYGSSEGTCYIICTPGTPDGALGVPQQGFEVEIVNALGEVCPAARFDASGVMLNPEEAIGEIVSRGAAARFEGYYKNPAASLDRLR